MTTPDQIASLQADPVFIDDGRMIFQNIPAVPLGQLSLESFIDKAQEVGTTLHELGLSIAGRQDTLTPAVFQPSINEIRESLLQVAAPLLVSHFLEGGRIVLSSSSSRIATEAHVDHASYELDNAIVVTAAYPHNTNFLNKSRHFPLEAFAYDSELKSKYENQLADDWTTTEGEAFAFSGKGTIHRKPKVQESTPRALLRAVFRPKQL